MERKHAIKLSSSAGRPGPAPAPLGRLRGEYRVQLLVKSSNRKMMRETLQSAVASRPDIQRRTTIDVDPVSVL